LLATVVLMALIPYTSFDDLSEEKWNSSWQYFCSPFDGLLNKVC
jgi:hypothetical protein